MSKQFNIKHLRIFLAAAHYGSFSHVAADFMLSQPAIAQAISGLELKIGRRVFERTAGGLLLTQEGELLRARCVRALGYLDPVLDRAGAKVKAAATTSQLLAATTLAETESYTIAAKQLGLSQSTVHRAVAELENVADSCLFDRVGNKTIPTRLAFDLAQAYTLAFRELAQAQMEIMQISGAGSAKLSIAVSTQCPASIVSNSLQSLKARCPAIAVEVVDLPPDQIAKSLAVGRVDAGLACIGDETIPAEIRKLARCPLKLKLAWRVEEESDSEGLEAVPTNRWWAVPNDQTYAYKLFTAWLHDENCSFPTSFISTDNLQILRSLVLDAGFVAVVHEDEFTGLNNVGAVSIPSHEYEFVVLVRADWKPTKLQELAMRRIEEAVACCPTV
ncbi:LysR family transcriptional regulator [Peteryoungia desertarenae]|uniref:LysR family transcriptional regulator n=1 Tax=Peteryoungia desertarenae TaxID=1813451 RepID=A0ABX6QIX7_9HYPH|nr:LysR family transcriptional regulator [Peteryoungia desertarenae]QLF68523.1 LysR family transcriptional regulator [Peteryoungia desertarenae]